MQEGQASGRPHDGPSGAVRCAWCGRILIGGAWRGIRGPATAEAEVEAHRWRTHTICPDCFAELAPGVPYPRTAPPEGDDS